MNIVLIGMRGSGKTTVAKILSQKLNKHYIETDDLVVKKGGMSIPKIVRQYGWNKIRELEEEAVMDATALDNSIISTGGGVAVRKENIKLLKKNGKIFWLKCSIGRLVKRIGNDPNRPSLTDKKTPLEEIKEVLKQREKLYQHAADVIVDTEGKNIAKVANEIIEVIKN